MSDRAKLELEIARLAEEIAQLFVSRQLTLAVAESCTGGLIAHSLTNVPGSSRFFLAGLCVYGVEAKVNVLGVPRELIQRHSVVSPEVAKRMAERVMQLCGSDVGLGTTGLAGPATGTEKLEVGTVFIATATKTATVAHRFHYHSDRVGTKLSAAIDALCLIRYAVLK
ncbi:MAG TPA: CinA family protein [bacterium]|nr:CinA family protein [bacterium]